MSSAFGRALSAVSVLVEAARANKIGAMHSPVSAREIVNAVRTQNLPEAFKEAERQVDEVVRVLAPGPKLGTRKRQCVRRPGDGKRNKVVRGKGE